MANKERASKAFLAMRELGVPVKRVKPVLIELLKTFGNKWEPIEEESYRLLKDAYFGKEEAEAMESINEHSGSSRPSKRLHMVDLEDQISTSKDCSSKSPDEEVMCAPMGLTKRKSSSSECSNSIKNFLHQLDAHDERKPFRGVCDITKGTENVEIALVDETGKEHLPKFTYLPNNIVYQDAYVHISLARISDENCCSDCSGDCVSSQIPCACAGETGGEFAYTSKGLLKEEFLRECMANPQDHHFVYCQDCPLERSKKPGKCKGHLVRRFIKECWRKCGCNMQCRNRIVQRGISVKLQVFLTHEGKGWGVRTLEDLPKGTFVCEYVGEILTNMELHQRNMQRSRNERHTYPVTLDADWGSEGILKDEEALCLDATLCGNVARFINHRCADANLIDIPVEIETADHHYYHLALFTTRDVRASEELTWVRKPSKFNHFITVTSYRADYGIDFQDRNHPIKAFKCCCASPVCRDVKQKGKRVLQL